MAVGKSVGVRWMSTVEFLDAHGFAVFLVNARDAKYAPGPETNVSDALRPQRLHFHRLLRASFRPEGEIAELRASLR
jgi:hypothetical protein